MRDRLGNIIEVGDFLLCTTGSARYDLHQVLVVDKDPSGKDRFRTRTPYQKLCGYSYYPHYYVKLPFIEDLGPAMDICHAPESSQEERQEARAYLRSPYTQALRRL